MILLGKLQGENLDDIYNAADIGLGSFGFYKIGLETASSLKTKECLSKGLPIIAGNKENFVKGEISKYYLDFPNDSSPVEIDTIIDFYESIYKGKNKRNVVDRIHTLAEKTVSMKVSLEPVIDYILK